VEPLFEKINAYKLYRWILASVLMLTLLFSGCTKFIPPPPEIRPFLKKLASPDYPVFTDDMLFDGLEHAIQQSLSYLHRIPSDKKFTFGNDVYDSEHMIRSMQHFLSFLKSKPTGMELNAFVRTNYLIYMPVDGKKTDAVLFTGYYEPFLEGSISKNREYRYPIFAIPSDLITIDLSPFHKKFKGQKITGRYTGKTVVPYHERKEIEMKGLLKDKADVLVWVKDPVDLFFLQIQGSGKIFLDNGNVVNVHYHAANGRPYRSIGRLLIKTDKILKANMSMQSIRAYLKDHPDEVNSILNYNPSYVFFKFEQDGPIGCLDTKLTPGRSLAVDRHVFPMSTLAFIKTRKPLVEGSGEITSWSDFSRFVLVQDTGGAIRGLFRADLFWGNGIYAEIVAGHMQHKGNLYFLILKPGVS